MADKPGKPPARRIMDGKVGDRFYVAEGYKGNHENAIGLPLNEPRGKAVPIPPGAPGTPNLAIYERKDFRKVDKKEPALKKE